MSIRYTEVEDPGMGPRGEPEILIIPEVVDDDEKLPKLPEWRNRHFYTIEQLGQPRPMQWLVEDWIAEGELSLIFGPGDSYKSFVALHWALEAAMDGKSVVYLAAEGAHGMRTRVPAWLRHHEVEPSECAGFRVDELPLMLDDKTQTDLWVREVEDALDNMPDWLIIDTMPMCFSGNESDPSEVMRLVRNCEMIRRHSEKRTAITAITHTPVRDSSRERGTAAYRNQTMSIIRLYRRKMDGPLTALMSCERMKEAESPNKQVVELAKIEWGDISSLAVDDFRAESGAKGKMDGKPTKKVRMN